MRHIILPFLLLFTLCTSNVYATNYYVKNGGDDNADGLSDATAWATVWKLDRHSFKPGDDVYFKSGDTWNRQNMVIDWSGSSSDRVIVGSYYLMNGIEAIGVPTNGSKPTITGGYTSNTSIGNVPNGVWHGLVELAGSYVTVQNIKVKDSSGYGIITGGTEHNIIENNEVTHVAGALIYGYKNSNHLIIRNNTGSQCTWSTADGINPYNSHPGCVSVTYSDYVLIENNNIHDLKGEGYSVTYSGSYNIIRNNVVSNGRFVGIYTNGGNNTIVENNLIVGGYTPGSYNDMDGIAISVERVSDGGNSVGTIIRNNLIANVRSCFYSDLFQESADAGKIIGLRYLNNTCVGASSSLSFSKGAANYTTSEVANNIFWDITGGENACGSPTDTDITFHHNSWSIEPKDADCKGTGDVYGNPNLKTSTDFRLFNKTNMPTEKDFEPMLGSIVENAGVALSTTILSAADYPNSTRVESCAVDLKKTTKDYRCADRNTTNPDMGALEIGSVAPNPTSTAGGDSQVISPKEVSIPFYMNIGSTEELALSKRYTGEAFLGSAPIYTGTSQTPINGTNDDELYQSWRGCYCDLTWNIPIADGTYDITLLFNEHYWGDEAGTCSGGERRFNIAIEGNNNAEEFDICAKAGAANTAVRYARTVEVVDGEVNIQLNPGTLGTLDNKPEIVGLEIAAGGSVVRQPLAPTRITVIIN